MKRIVLLTVICSIIGAVPAFAAGPGASSPTPSAKVITFGSLIKSAGIDQIVADQSRALARRDVFAASIAPLHAPRAAQKKSFWKTPWPYVIAGGAIAIGLAIAYSGDGSGNGY